MFQIFSLPEEKDDNDVLAVLPRAPEYILPRRRSIPVPKEKTRWEKFAETKGIEKRKRSRMVWDELEKDWRPRWGHKSVKKTQDQIPVIEVRPGQDPYVDPFEERSKAKQLVKAKQKSREYRNKLEGAGFRMPRGVADLQK
eukprot:Platyproteum_vivax@DN10661_c0_g1_i1.p2